MPGRAQTRRRAARLMKVVLPDQSELELPDGPRTETGLYSDFESPEPIHESDLERIEEEMRRELAEGRSWERREVTAEEARRFFAEQDEPYKVELVETADGPISFYTQGD